MEAEESYARVVWASRILSYLSKDRYQTGLVSSEMADNESSLDDEDEEPEIQSTDATTFPDSCERLKEKFLDCLAELLSSSKGWDDVTATALREREDYIEIDIASNRGFQITQNKELKPRGKENITPGCLFDILYECMAAQIPEGDEERREALLVTLEDLAIECNKSRIFHWTERLVSFGSSSGPDIQNKNAQDNASMSSHLIEITNIIKTEQHRHHAKARRRVVRLAYLCTRSGDAQLLLPSKVGKAPRARIWKALLSLARPIFNCRLLAEIALRLPQFRNIKFITINPPQPMTLNSKFITTLPDALQRLNLECIAPFDSDKLNNDFQKHCSKALHAHAEIQLLAEYSDKPHSQPTLSYFGCSKKSCLLCESFMDLVSPRIRSRGRHGICYPAWGLPSSSLAHFQVVLAKLESVLIERIQEWIRSPNRFTRGNVAQSSLVSDLNATDLNEIIERKLRIESEELKRSQRLKEGRLLTDPRSITMKRSEEKFDETLSSEVCIMCEKQGKRCTKCRSCCYCSKECQRADWQSHRLLCAQVSKLPKRPTLQHKLAIYFPVEASKPKLEWVGFWVRRGVQYPQIDHIFRSEGHDVTYRTMRRGPLRGGDLGYELDVYTRTTVHTYGSKPNRSIIASVGITASIPLIWSGPCIVLRRPSPNLYGDITLADLRHIVDLFVTCGDFRVKEIEAPTLSGEIDRESDGILGVKVNSDAEIENHGAARFVPVIVREFHPMRCFSTLPIMTSPISRLLGMPLKLWRIADGESHQALHTSMAYNSSLECNLSDNCDITSLMMETELDSESWGFAPMWTNLDYLGNVVVIREDEQDLSVDQLKLLCHFCERKLQPLFEDALGSGHVQRTREEVLAYITPENLERFKDELIDESDEDEQIEELI